ncbi:MAG: saccharopine dehydrogenase C-terminal domain-containing protein [Candidatus Aminicenantes bacterium]
MKKSGKPYKVLVLGAGSVAPPVIDYLLKQSGFELILADQYSARAEKLIKDHPSGIAVGLDIHQDKPLQAAVSSADIVISLLPYVFHSRIADACLKNKKNLITASYVSEELKSLDKQVRDSGLLFLNEIGLDPGLDHMEAKRIIDRAGKNNGDVLEFISYCGGLPAPEANNNPFGYKFSWSPRGVLLAGKNPADYLQDGRKIHVPARRLFKSTSRIPVENIGELEGYPNRNSLSYIDLYGTRKVKTMLRGTLRYPGWCEFMDMAQSTGLLREEEMDWFGFSCRDFVRRVSGNRESGDIRAELASTYELDSDSTFIQCLDFLELFSEKPLPLRKGSPLDVMVHLMEAKLRYKPNERDMVILKHSFSVSYPDGTGENITSTLLDFGIPGGHSAMARTVGLPVGAAAKLVLEGSIQKTGVHIPVTPDIYQPILLEMKREGISFQETVKKTEI